MPTQVSKATCHQPVASIPYSKVSGEICLMLVQGDPPLNQKQRNRLSISYITLSNIGSQLFLTSPSTNVLPGRGSEKAINECLGVNNAFPPAA